MTLTASVNNPQKITEDAAISYFPTTAHSASTGYENKNSVPKFTVTDWNDDVKMNHREGVNWSDLANDKKALGAISVTWGGGEGGMGRCGLE